MDRADAALGAVMDVAARGGDLEEAVAELLHVCGRRRDALEFARSWCRAQQSPGFTDPVIARALQLLDGALRTPLYATVSR
jgi:hypothetical protein